MSEKRENPGQKSDDSTPEERRAPERAAAINGRTLSSKEKLQAARKFNRKA
ncbi:MAG: hypothetical protein LBS89_09100 [Zoogloeaceae bacterium]|jgi:hypothetical protein|nr:hypothetical protein [Zoogloeaceae bacterium]